ncbi:hypothetical protein [Eleftheria terrae]|uniref:hypothetical protein n=1 Tax=Eleftheria terrae TaxID=1597781 RepID=UPI00263ACE07|nr:hypothetical protein [Eleftheria terrae]WKB53923.1 hypothetical protein N7L95_05920 [Eleftheria terrae]
MNETGSAPLPEQDRCDCAVTADFLATSRCWDGLAAGSAALAAWLLARQAPAAGWPAAMLLLALGIERYLAVRLSLDRRLFERLARAEGLCLATLDAALAAHFRLPPHKVGRALAPRIAGARRLYRAHVAAALALSGLALAALAGGAWT